METDGITVFLGDFLSIFLSSPGSTIMAIAPNLASWTYIQGYTCHGQVQFGIIRCRQFRQTLQAN